MRACALAILLITGAPTTSAQSFLTQDGYPKRALREGREGTAAFTVDVTIEGKAENCVITQSTGSADLDEATCQNVINKARINPALGDNGQPVRGKYSGRMNWKISQ